jgi:hypothetical protein
MVREGMFPHCGRIREQLLSRKWTAKAAHEIGFAETGSA